jgi:methylmalonyl-CoA decarboxylase
MELIRAWIEDRIGVIALNNYVRRNALSQALIGECLDALDEFKIGEVRTVILRSSQPEKVWSAGHAIDELPRADRDPLPYDDPLEKLLRAVVEFPAPVIAMVQGSAWGGACDLVVTCDMAFADETSSFAITPAKLGLPYNAVGVLHFLNRLPLNIVMEMFCTAEPIQAERAARVGILNEVVHSAELEAHVWSVAQTIASRSAEAIASFKATARALAEAMPITPSTFERIHGMRRQVYLGGDYNEGVRAFAEKRTPRFCD